MFQINHAAYMDDTILIGKNKQEIVKLYDVVNSFFCLTDIQANESKFKLLTINSEETGIKIRDHYVKKDETTNGVRYLGVWFNQAVNKKSGFNKIKFFCWQFLKDVKYSNIMDKQFLYLWNH